MKYQGKSFTVPMPSEAGEAWDKTFRSYRDTTGGVLEACPGCGRMAVLGSPHIDQRDEDAKRPVKKVCFGKVVA